VIETISDGAYNKKRKPNQTLQRTGWSAAALMRRPAAEVGVVFQKHEETT
jgi:hypothetical protein